MTAAEARHLTDPDYWDAHWRSVELPVTVDVQGNRTFRAFHRVFRRFLPDGKNASYSLAEIGCTPGRWLIYFAREFGYQVSGCDSSEMGLAITKANLEMSGVQPSDLWLWDIEEADTSKTEAFDLVVSLGVVEHFQNPLPVISNHVSMLKEGGYLVLEVPNLRGANGIVQSWINPEKLRLHTTTIMSRSWFGDVATRFGLRVVYLDYVAGFEPVALSPNDDKWRKILSVLLRGLWRARSPLSFLDSLNNPLFSGYIMAIYTK